MIKFITRLLGGTHNPAPRAPAPRLDHMGETGAFQVGVGEAPPDFHNDPDYTRIAREELGKSSDIRPEAYTDVLLHLRNKNTLFETKTVLSVEEKRKLGINTRLKITSELVAVLTPQALQGEHPASIIPTIRLAAEFRYRRTIELAKLRSFDLCESVTFITVDEQYACDWCNKVKSQNFSVHQDLDKLREDNCKCTPYWKGYISPNLKAF